MTEPEHPGVHLAQLMRKHKISGRELKTALRIDQMRITRILAKTQAITVDTAIRFARFFETTPEYWLELQLSYDLAQATRQRDALRFTLPTLSSFLAERTAKAAMKAAARAQKVSHAKRRV